MLNKKLLYLLTIVFISAVGMRFNISILAWVMFVPLLLLARETAGKKAWFGFFALMQVAYFLQIAKIVTDPMPLVMALMFSAPMALVSWVLLWLFEKARRRIGDMWGVFLFASLMSVSEWANFYSVLGTWGSMTYTQLDDLAFLQLCSLFGITFGSFFIYLSSAFVTVFIANSNRKLFIKPAIVSSVIFTLFYAYGVWRVESAKQQGKHVLVAGISSNMQITPKGIPDKKYLEEGTNILLDKTKIAIERGAKLIAWNEGATIVMEEDEPQFVEKVKKLSSENSVDLFIAYIMPIDGIKKFENKYIFISKGKILDEYFKFHPVPGEAAVKGEKEAVVADLGYAKVSGAICYDFDFPTLGRGLSQKEADIVVVPSSDWEGIKTIHGLQAMVRAIEGGYSLLRPVRGATSFAFDAYGNIRASMSYFEDNDRIMMASLPTKRVRTLYAVVGDIFPFGLLVFLGLIGLIYLRKK